MAIWAAILDFSMLKPANPIDAYAHDHVHVHRACAHGSADEVEAIPSVKRMI